MANLRVLVIDDATFIRDMIKKSLRDSLPSAEIFEANDGKKGLQQLKNGTYDLILCDWEMPEMNGDELLKWIRDSDKHKATPFIMVTSRGEKEHLVTAITSGASDYLVKPFNNEILQQKILKALKKAGKLRPSDLKGRATHVATGFALDTVDVLTTGPKAIATTFDEGSAPQKPKVRVAKENEALGQAQVRFSHGSYSCIIKRITEFDFMGIIRRPETQLPSILEQVVVDIAQPKDEDNVARLNGYVTQLICTEDKIDTRFLNITVRFVDDDPAKLAFLNEFMTNA